MHFKCWHFVYHWYIVPVTGRSLVKSLPYLLLGLYNIVYIRYCDLVIGRQFEKTSKEA
jgi:hypothetical protein